MVFVSIADALNDSSCLLSDERSLLATRTLHRVCVGIKGHHLARDVVFDEAERLA